MWENKIHVPNHQPGDIIGIHWKGNEYVENAVEASHLIGGFHGGDIVGIFHLS